jgi:two-component system response regulator AtoC
MESPEILIYVVEDNEWYNKLLVHSLSLNPSYTVKPFFNGEQLLAALHEEPAIITIDYHLPDMNGLVLIKRVKELYPQIEIIAISEQNEIETAVDLIKAGAFDYLVKSKDIKDRILNSVQNIAKNLGLKKQLVRLQKEVQGKYAFQQTIIGQSKAIDGVFELIKKATESNITVTITGETGTGKEVVAKAIHYNSAKKDKPFIPINMAAIPSELVESELFGHEKGAFTGAIQQRIGKFEEANGGTLFLDEMGEMDMNAQVKLLRALQEKEITRVGSNTPVKINCRIIVATHQNLIEEVKKGNFREDLYYRLVGLPIHLPRLAERDNDIILLAHHFLKLFCKENDLPIKQLSEKAQQKLLAYRWPGNIRELKSIIDLACVLSNELTITDKDITFAHGGDLLPDMMGKEQTMREYNRRIVQIYMERYQQDTKIVAEKLGIGQTTVYRLINESKQ